MSFYKKCQRLRNLYSLNYSNSELQLMLLAKLVSTSFYLSTSKMKEDALPICSDFLLSCKDFEEKYSFNDIKTALSKVLLDLDFHDFSITPYGQFSFYNVIKLRLN